MTDPTPEPKAAQPSTGDPVTLPTLPAVEKTRALSKKVDGARAAFERVLAEIGPELYNKTDQVAKALGLHLNVEARRLDHVTWLSDLQQARFEEGIRQHEDRLAESKRESDRRADEAARTARHAVQLTVAIVVLTVVIAAATCVQAWVAYRGHA